MDEWRIYGKKADFNRIAREFGISPVTARVIRNRDVCDMEEIRDYLYGTKEQLYSPFLMKDLEKACDILLEKIREGRKLRVAGDYDCDGVNATYILLTALKRLGGDVDFVIPDRIHDGYGINEEIVKKAAAEGVDTLLTCDNGIAATDQVLLAGQLGMTVIVTDHHDIPERGVPLAAAVVNPKQQDCPYPFKGLCGAAVAFKLVQAMYEKGGIPAEEAFAYLEFAALATVADVMELKGENRILVREGIARLRRTENIGLNALIQACKLKKEAIVSYHLGFVIGPCLNASGRLETAALSLELLMCTDENRAQTVAENLRQLNETRKDMTVKGTEEAVALIEREHMENDPVLVVYLPDCHESIAGIIAGRLKEKYHRPSIVLTDSLEGVKGSGRSIEAYHMFHGLQQSAEWLDKFGGHPMAAGLSLKKENVAPFRQSLIAQAGLKEQDFVKRIWLDMELPFAWVSMGLVEELKALEPFGNGNSRPLFGCRQVAVRRGRVIGRNANVLRLSITDAQGTQAEGVWFGDTEELIHTWAEKYGQAQVENMLRGYQNDIRFTIAYYPTINEYAGRQTLQITIQNFIA